MAKALVSVFNKEGLEDFARFIRDLGVGIVSSGGTARFLRKAGIEVTPVGSMTGFPEVLDGRVKTLHPKVHAGILARRSLPEDMDTLKTHSIDPVDWVVVNLYPFREKVQELQDEKDLLEFIDIGGPTMIRAAAKNFYDVVVVCDPADYGWIQTEYTREGRLTLQHRRQLAAKVFRLMSEYDGAIADFLMKKDGGDN